MKIVYITPHLSTGGLPQFVLTRVRAMLGYEEAEIHVIEWRMYSHVFTVQRNQIIELLGNNFHELEFDNRENQIKETLEKINPDIIHIDECPEAFDGGNKFPYSLHKWIYSNERNWKITETCHNAWFQENKKRFTPDMFTFCTPTHLEVFRESSSSKSVIQYPMMKSQKVNDEILDLDKSKIHVLNVGLWTSGKNQKEGLKIAEETEKIEPGKYMFHFVGNQAMNFKDYWEPLMENLPENVKIWGEQNNVNKFLEACDIFMFNSTWECNPLAIREAIGHNMAVFSRNLDFYGGMFTEYVHELKGKIKTDTENIINVKLGSKKNSPENEMDRFRDEHINMYNRMLLDDIKREERYIGASFSLTFDNGVKLNCSDLDLTKKYRAEIWDGDRLVYSPSELKSGCWYKPSITYFVPWIVKVFENDDEIFSETFSVKDKDVYISFGSSSLGDSLSWMGQVINFKKETGCKKLYVKTYRNELFDIERYEEDGIYVIDERVDCDIHMHLGVFMSEEKVWKDERHLRDWRKISIGQIAADIIGIKYIENRPYMNKEYIEKSYNDSQKSIVIGPESTAQLKFWNREGAWQHVIDWHIDNGYIVYYAGKDKIHH